MKRCPQCQETYTDEAIKFCRLDGAPLQIINYSPAESSDTLVLLAKDARDTLPTQLLQSETSQAQVIASPSTTARDLSAGGVSDILGVSSTEKLRIGTKRRGRALAMVLSVVILATIGLGYWYFFNRVAVLPFENKSSDAAANGHSVVIWSAGLDAAPIDSAIKR